MSAETLTAIAVALGAGWASGLNAYAAVLFLGIAQRLGVVALPHDLQVLESPWVLGVAAILFALNFLADKIPYVDSINDVLQTFVRIPAGMLLAYGAAAGLSPPRCPAQSAKDARRADEAEDLRQARAVPRRQQAAAVAEALAAVRVREQERERFAGVRLAGPQRVRVREAELGHRRDQAGGGTLLAVVAAGSRPRRRVPVPRRRLAYSRISKVMGVGVDLGQGRGRGHGSGRARG